MWVTICDTGVALTAGFVIIPSVVGAGSEMTAGPSLVFLAMTDIFGKFPGGRIIGFFFFTALIFAVLSTYFTILEIPVKCLEEKAKISHRKATVLTSIFIFGKNLSVSVFVVQRLHINTRYANFPHIFSIYRSKYPHKRI